RFERPGRVVGDRRVSAAFLQNVRVSQDGGAFGGTGALDAGRDGFPPVGRTFSRGAGAFCGRPFWLVGFSAKRSGGVGAFFQGTRIVRPLERKKYRTLFQPEGGAERAFPRESARRRKRRSRLVRGQSGDPLGGAAHRRRGMAADPREPRY